MTTFDNIMVKRENFVRVAEAFEMFLELHPPGNRVESLSKQAATLRRISDDAEFFAVCWNQTIVNCGIWNSRERRHPEDEDVFLPYDISLDEGHWFLFEGFKAHGSMKKRSRAMTDREREKDTQIEIAEALRKYLPSDWDVRVVDGRIEVREWAARSEPLFHFDVTRNAPDDLLEGIPAIIGGMISQMHRDFCELRKFTKEAVAGCAAPDELAGPVTVKLKSMPIRWELSEGIEDAFPGVVVRREREKESKTCPDCEGSGFGETFAGVQSHCKGCDGLGIIPA